MTRACELELENNPLVHQTTLFIQLSQNFGTAESEQHQAPSVTQIRDTSYSTW